MKQAVILGIISYPVFPAEMGGQKCVEGFYKQLSTQTKLVLAVAKQNRTDRIPGAHTENFLYDHWKGPLNMLYLIRLIRLIRKQQVDVIIIEHSYFGWLGLILRFFTGKKMIIRSHNIEAYRFRDLQRPFWKLYYSYERFVHRKADHSFFITEEDLSYALKNWKLDPAKTSVVTYGVSLDSAILDLKPTLRKKLLEHFNIPNNYSLFLFSGTLNYTPNTDALHVIVYELLPRLRNQSLSFRIFICGKNLSAQWKKVLKEQPELIVTGFVDDISIFMSGADCSINPVTLGGGIKTKLVEALAYHQTVITTQTGAKGISTALTGSKMKIVPDYDWELFANAMNNFNPYQQANTPEPFFERYHWPAIVDKALVSLESL
ncbi:MAG: glycosyltransferase family 4 protein [Bacteroidota bacterium]